VSGDVNTGRATLALDDLLTDPLGRELLAEVNADLPAHLVDQLDAARDDTLRLLRFEAPLIGGQVTELDFAGMPEWVRLPMLTTYVAWALGRGKTCTHSPTPQRPEPVFAVAWRPELVTCARCVHLTVLHPGSRLDRTCDCCGRVVAGIDRGHAR